MEIYIARNGKQTGPFTEEQTRQMLSAGMLSRDDSAWTDGAADWQPLSLILGLSQPPPIPTASRLVSPTPTVAIDGPQGIGGWLVLFCVGLTILGPLRSLVEMYTTWIQSQSAFDRFPMIKTVIIWENFGSIVLLIYGFIVGCLIWSGNPQGRKIARRFLLIRLFGFIGIEIIALIMMSDLPKEVIEAG